jgi:hypothetical protein
LRRAIYAGWIDQEKYLEQRDLLQNDFLQGDETLHLRHATKEEFAAFQASCAKAEASWMETHIEAIRRVVSDTASLPAPWDKLTARLGKHVFDRSLKDRKKP